jgi:hypothetical protein
MSIVNLHLESSPNDLSAELKTRKRQVKVVQTKPYSVHFNNSSGAPHGLRNHAGLYRDETRATGCWDCIEPHKYMSLIDQPGATHGQFS